MIKVNRNILIDPTKVIWVKRDYLGINPQPMGFEKTHYTLELGLEGGEIINEHYGEDERSRDFDFDLILIYSNCGE